MRIWTHKNADEKAHTLSRRSKNVKKRTKTYEKRILCKFTLIKHGPDTTYYDVIMHTDENLKAVYTQRVRESRV